MQEGIKISRLLLSADLHLGHNNIHKYRAVFADADEHHNTIFENLATTVRKSDTLYLLGDVAFDHYWLDKIKSINCRHKKLICGNHDTERGITMRHLVDVYDSIHALYCKRNYWFSHCPIHFQEMRGRNGCIHGHLHNRIVEELHHDEYTDEVYWTTKDKRYINVCLEHTGYKPITFEEVINK
ncbi:MAG: hypothetical protein GOVbin2917_88 [Prokaryotic dsDNA virus sp.]|nr:MAG: hypothetical protein GOVbin2917_88 [Prokaryotic dsDNA virus sp.]